MNGRLEVTRQTKDIGWAAAFAGLALMAAALARPPSMLTPPSQSRIVIDAEGRKVAVPLPFKTVAGVNYLEVTHAPETLFKVGGPGYRSTFATMPMSRFYPEVLKSDDLWNVQTDVESLLAHADGVTFFAGVPLSLWRRLGIPVLATASNSAVPEDHIFGVTRIANAARGDAERGESIINEYQAVYGELEQELQPETLTNRPRVLGVGSSSQDWSKLVVAGSSGISHDDKIVGVVNAAIGFEDVGRQQEAERLLAMNPDIIFVAGESVKNFRKDPRWRGLKAILNNRVYEGVSFRPGLPTWSLDERPLGARWIAEIVHPERLQPKMRDIMRAHFLKAYGYRLSDDEIDEVLHVAENKDVVGYERFTKRASMNERSEMAQ